MKLGILNIHGYKNLENLTIDFSTDNGVALLVGNNGSGKSNILEAVSAIFADLYNEKLKKQPEFDYKLSYEVNGRNINISRDKGEYVIEVNSNTLSKKSFTEDRDNLPSNIISCYSGECKRLWDNYYWPYYTDYIDKVRTSEKTPQLPLVYINKDSLCISLLTLFYHDFDTYLDIASFCNGTLGIRAVKRIEIDFNAEKIRAWKTNGILNLAQAICEVDDVSKIASHVELSIEEFRDRVSRILSNGKELFFRLYGATMPKEHKIISGITIECELTNGSNITVEDLSEGEKKELLITTILEVLADENSLILFDEPDSHIHITRKRDIKKILDRFENKRESILTTHSPTLASAFEYENHIIGLGLDENNMTRIIDKSTADLISEITDGIWNIQQQNIFLASNKPVTLLVEGKTDKVHIEEAFRHLESDFPELDFDIFSMNSSEHIREVLIGLSCSEIKWNKKFIGIFDNDDAGQKDIKNGFEKEVENELILHVKYKDREPSKCFYAFLLPRPDTFSSKEGFTIENCYPAFRYQDAFEQALNEKKGHFDNHSIDKIAEDLKNKAKVILAKNSKGFPAHDFDGFRAVFSRIREINGL